MATVEKTNYVIGFLMKEEATPNTAETLSNTADGCNTYIGEGDPPAPSDVSAVFDGKIGRAAGSLAGQKRTVPNGRYRSLSFPTLFRGLGSAYSSTDTPPLEVHRAMKGAGYTATYAASPSAQWTYTPTVFSTTPTHLTVGQYVQGDLYTMRGVQFNWTYTADGLGVPVHTFEGMGIHDALTEAALPSITLLASAVIPPVASGVTLTLGSYTGATLRKISFNNNRGNGTARIAQNAAGGHAGFVYGARRETWEVEIERPLRSNYDPEALRDAATSFAFSVQYGSTQYNRWKHGSAQAQIVNVVPGNDGPIPTVTLTIEAHASTPSANDASYALFN